VCSSDLHELPVTRSCREKQILSKVLSEKILKKYKLLSAANSVFGLRRRQFLRYLPRQYNRFCIDDVEAAVALFCSVCKLSETVHDRRTLTLTKMWLCRKTANINVKTIYHFTL